MLKLDGFFKHFTKNKMSFSSSKNTTGRRDVCSVVTCSQSDNHTVQKKFPFSVFVIFLKCLFSFEVSITENKILSVTGLVICKDIIQASMQDF